MKMILKENMKKGRKSETPLIEKTKTSTTIIGNFD